MKLKLTEEQMAVHGIIDGPVWQDGCEHGAGAYLASFTLIRPGPKLARVDLYVFDDHGGQSICLRTGDDPENYISPGRIMHFCRSASLHRHKLPEYWRAFEILENFGCLTWKPIDL